MALNRDRPDRAALAAGSRPQDIVAAALATIDASSADWNDCRTDGPLRDQGQDEQ